MNQTGEQIADRILSYLHDDASRPLKPIELSRELGLGGEEYDDFLQVLERLEDEGLVYGQREGRYAVPEKLNLAVGRLSVTKGGDGFVNTRGRDEQDVFIPERHLGTAVEGDIVVARIEKRPARKNPQGRIIRVQARARSRIVGTYHSKRNYGFVAAEEPSLRMDLFIPPDYEGDAKDGQVVVVEVLDWGDEEPNPVGRVVQVLGRPEEAGVDVLSIVHGHGLPLEFPEEVEEEARRIAEEGLGEDEIAAREDLRDELVFTIDPPDAKDHDDALSLVELDGGGYRLGVHIADVSHYVRPGTLLDEEALQRATSVYLVDRVIPMLPHALSSDLCSLVPGEDRLAMSVMFELDEELEIRGSRVSRTVIRSDHRLSYDEAHGILEEDEDGPEELRRALRGLSRISGRFREERERRGSIDFDLPESRVILNAAGEPTDIERVLRLPTHRLIEDLMILANETVASLALDQELPLIYRVHADPAEEKVDQLRELAATFGYHLPSRKVSPGDLAGLVEAMKDTDQEQLISTATLRSMQKAVYSPRNEGHFGLASDAYSHFTSPIRRYPDLVVHRQLARWLADEGEARRVPEERLEAISGHCSERERRAEQAERDSVDLKKIEYMERHLGEKFEGTISGVTAFGFFVLLDEYHVEGLVHVSTMNDDYYVFVEEQHALIGQRKRRKFQLGDRTRVQIARVDRESRQIDFELLPED